MAQQDGIRIPFDEQIRLRVDLQRLMRQLSWPEELQDAIMHNDSPPVQEVIDMTYELGPEKTKRRLLLKLWGEK